MSDVSSDGDQDFDYQKETDFLNENYHFNTTNEIDPEIEKMKTRIKEIEVEAEKIQKLQSEVDDTINFQSLSTSTAFANKEEIDGRSIYVGNVDYGASAEELEAHFHECGIINRVTILCNKIDGHSKGFAYIEFSSKEYIELALKKNETYFRGRLIKVLAKRTNRPGFSVATNRFSQRNAKTAGLSGRYCYGRSYRGIKWPLKGYSSYDNIRNPFPY